MLFGVPFCKDFHILGSRLGVPVGETTGSGSLVFALGQGTVFTPSNASRGIDTKDTTPHNESGVLMI